MPLPDLVARNLTPFTASNGRNAVRMIMQNAGERDAGPFQYALRVDGASSPLATYDFPGLAAGETADAFYFPTDLSAGEHLYSFTIDDPRTVPETDETNNHFEEWIALQPATVSDPQSLVGPGLTRPSTDPAAVALASVDLLVSAIRLKGEDANGNNDCDPGKNDVTVVIKNQGTGGAANFAVRLVVDGEDDEAKDKAVANLGASASLDVTFDDLPLKKGEHKLTATVDSKKAITESKEDNNELKDTVNCRDEDD